MRVIVIVAVANFWQSVYAIAIAGLPVRFKRMEPCSGESSRSRIGGNDDPIESGVGDAVHEIANWAPGTHLHHGDGL